MSEKLSESADRYEAIADELAKAVEHYQTAARHFRGEEVPRGCAHAFAGWGHINKAEAILKAEAIKHSHHLVP